MRLASKKEKDNTKALKKREREEAREARDIEKQLQAERKLMQQKQKLKKVVFTIPEEPTIEQVREVEDGVVKSASGRPQRVRKPPQHLKDSVIVIE